MNDSVLRKYRTLLRKKLAATIRLHKMGKISKPTFIARSNRIKGCIQDKIPTILKINAEVGEEMLQYYTFGKLLSVLETLLQEEQNQYINKKPSQNDIKRWALRLALLEYYKALGVPSNTPVLDSLTSGKTIHKFAPDKQAVYNIWLRKLSDLSKRDDINQVSPEEYDEAYNRGIPQGGAFERMLLRYREEFVKRLLQS